MRRAILLLALALTVVAGILAVRWLVRPPPSRSSAAFAVLDHQCRGLASLVTIARVRPLVAPKPILFVIDESVVRSMVEATLPFEREIESRFRIRVDSVTVRFDDGFSWVRLDCNASLAVRSPRDASAQISVYGGLEIVGVDAATGALVGRVTVFSVDARDIAVLQMDAPVERLLDALKKVELEKFGVLLSRLQIPVQLERVLTLPAIGPQGGVSVPALSLPLSASVEDVKAFRGRLWVAVSVNTDSLPAAAPPRTVAEGPRAADGGTSRKPSTLGRATSRRFHLSLRPPALLRHREDSTRVRHTPSRLAALALRRAALHDSLEAAIRDDPLIQQAIADSGNVLVVIQSAFVTTVMRRVLERYFDRVALSLTLRKEVHRSGVLHVGTPFGKVAAGQWTVDLTVRSISGILRAQAPRLAVTRANHLDVAVPVHLENGRGGGYLDFDWDSRSLVSVLCRDFSVGEALSGRVLPGDYEVHGGFRIAAEGSRLVAIPEFPREKYRIMVDLDAASWSRVRSALATQTPTARCGILLRPETVLEHLQAIGRRGFLVSLPRSIFRTVALPVGISQTVQVEDRPVEVAVRPLALLVTPELLWYSARASATRG